MGTAAAFAVALAHLGEVARVGLSSPSGFLAVAGCCALTLGPLGWLVCSAGRWPTGTRRLLAGVALALPLLWVLGTLLFSGTRHRPLGAATFATLGVGLLVATVLLVVRLRDPQRQLLSVKWGRPVEVVLTLGWAGVMGFLAWRAAQADAAPLAKAAWQLGLIVAVFLLSLHAAGRITVPRWLRVCSVVIWLLAVAIGLWLSQAGPLASGAVLRAAPVATWPWAGLR